ncbi:hypothetical protein TNCV_1324161 [Trichonephila clavipes]|nr:hypothetical protein TNCV_1324161 [Trichonephila clavipes]
MLNEDQSADEVRSESHAELKDMAKNGFHKCFDELYKPCTHRGHRTETPHLSQQSEYEMAS